MEGMTNEMKRLKVKANERADCENAREPNLAAHVENEHQRANEACKWGMVTPGHRERMVKKSRCPGGMNRQRLK